MNALDFYRWFGDWADELIQLIVFLLVAILGYLLTVFYRWKKKETHIWDPELPFFAFALTLLLGLLFGMHLEERYERQLAVLQQKELVQQVDMKTTIDPALMSAADKMLKLKEFKASLTGSMTESVSAFMDNIRQNYPGLEEESYRHCGRVMRREMREKIPAVLQKITSLYAGQYSVEEFGTLNAFYSSPVGQKIRQTETALSPRVFQITYMWSYRASQMAGDYLSGFTPLEIPSGNLPWKDHGKTGMTVNNAEKDMVADPEHMAAARKYLEVSGYENILAATMRTTVKLANETVRKMHPNLKEDVYKGYVEIFAAEMRKDIPGIMDEVALLCADQYTLSEFKEMNAFFSSPIGKKSKQVDTKLSDVMMEILQKWTLQAAEKAASCIKLTG